MIYQINIVTFKYLRLTAKLLLGILLLFVVNELSAQTIKGQVRDASTQLPIPFATVYYTGTTIGTTTDLDGYFELRESIADSITATSLSYIDLSLPKNATLDFLLPPSAQDLEEIVVNAKRKAERDSAAIQLFRKVVKNKPKNALHQVASFTYEAYEKTEFDIYNIQEGFINKKVLKPFDFLFDYVDSTEAGEEYLPVLLREKLKRVYYQKEPTKRKEVLLADQFSGVKDYWKWQLVDWMFDEMDVYQNVIPIQGKAFISPIADGGLIYYKYFLTDSMVVDGETCYKLEFTPRRKGDLAVAGHLWVHEPTSAIYQVQAWLPHYANINLIAELAIHQDFTLINGKHWVKQHETMVVHLNITQKDKHQNIRIVKTDSRRDIQLNRPISSDAFKGETFAMEEAAWHRDSSFWATNRHLPLKKSEEQIYQMMDTLKSTPAYKRLFWLIHLANSGYLSAGPVEFGPWYRFFSWNALEGNRYKIGLKTNKYLFKEKLHLNGYLAYGNKDKLWKYHLGMEAHLPRKHYLMHRMGGHYRYDWSFDYEYNPWWSHDHLITQSLLRKAPIANLFLYREGHVFYEKEWMKGFIQRFGFTHKSVYPWKDVYQFQTADGESIGRFETVEFLLRTKWLIRQKNKVKRKADSPFNFSRPYLTMDYVFSPKNVLGSDFSYHRMSLGLIQNVYTNLGKTKLTLQGGAVLGTVPYPLLKIHAGNQSLFYNKFAYNMMNGSEYASDLWTSLWLEHKFDGLIFNAIPGIRRLKLRSLFSAKVVTGSLRDKNEAFLRNAFPQQIDSMNLTAERTSLQDINGVYVELGVGIENIAKVGRIDFLWRLTPSRIEAAKYFGIRLQIQPVL